MHFPLWGVYKRHFLEVDLILLVAKRTAAFIALVYTKVSIIIDACLIAKVFADG